MDSLIAITAVFGYILAVATIIPGLTQQSGIKSKTVMTFAAIALTLHGWLLAKLILAVSGQNLSLLNVSLAISFIVSLFMTSTMLKNRLWFILPIVYGFSSVNITAAAFMPYAFIKHLESDPKLLIHILLALFSYATLTIGALYAIQVAWLDNKLKNKKALIMNRNLPPLMQVERQLFKVILIGNLLLTGALITGYAFVHDMFAQGKAHKAVFSFIAWIVYSILLWGHYRKGWRGRSTIGLSVGGVILLTLAYFGSRFVQEFLLN